MQKISHDHKSVLNDEFNLFTFWINACHICIVSNIIKLWVSWHNGSFMLSSGSICHSIVVKTCHGSVWRIAFILRVRGHNRNLIKKCRYFILGSCRIATRQISTHPMDKRDESQLIRYESNLPLQGTWPPHPTLQVYLSPSPLLPLPPLEELVHSTSSYSMSWDSASLSIRQVVLGELGFTQHYLFLFCAIFLIGLFFNYLH